MVFWNSNSVRICLLSALPHRRSAREKNVARQRRITRATTDNDSSDGGGAVSGGGGRDEVELQANEGNAAFPGEMFQWIEKPNEEKGCVVASYGLLYNRKFRGRMNKLNWMKKKCFYRGQQLTASTYLLQIDNYS